MATEPISSEKPVDETIKRNARYGLCLFAVYLSFYGCFIALNLAAPKVMAGPALGGMNLAIVFGFALILAAIALALLYMWMCSRNVTAESGR